MKRFFTYTIILICLFTFSSYGTTYNVTSYSDSGPGTLRQAIIDINNQPAGAPHTIQFLIGTSGTINLFSPLPTFTSQIYINTSYQIILNGNGIAGPMFKGPISRLSYQYFTPVNFSSATYYVTTTNLSGSGSFLEVISYCEQTPTKDYIYFNIPGQPPHVLDGTSNLSIIESVCIDGSTQPANGYAGALPKIALNNDLTYVYGKDSELYGLMFYKHLNIFATFRNGSGGTTSAKADNCTIGKSGSPNVFANGIAIYSSKNSTIQYNYFGMDMNSTAFTANGQSGIFINDTENTRINNNIIANYSTGIYCSADTATSIKGNKIGTNAAGTSIVGTGTVGIYITGSKNLQIGGTTSSERNIISGHTHSEIQITPARILHIKGNYIGTDITGTIPLSAPSARGISIDFGDSLTIGGSSLAGEGNLIVSNDPMIINQATKTHVWGNRFNIAANETPLLVGNYNGIIVQIQCDVEIGKTQNGYGNRFHGFANYGVRVQENNITLPQYQSYATIRGNSFTNNAWGGIGSSNTIAPIITAVSGTAIQGISPALAVVDLYYHNGTVPLQGKTYLATVTANSVGAWSYSGTLSTPCSITATATLSKNTSSFSKAYWFKGLGNDVSICQNAAPITLHATGGISYGWSPATYLDDATSSNPVFSPGETQSYTVSITNNQNCVGYDTLNVTVTAAPDAPNVTSPISYCKNAQATDLSATGDDLKWYTAMNGTPSAIAPVPYTEVTGSTTYYVTQTSGGCSSSYAAIDVNITDCMSTGNENSSFSEVVLLFPQPFVNTTKLQLKNGQTLQSIYVFNSSGTLKTKVESINSSEIEIGEDLESGIYLLLIETSQGNYQTKISKTTF